MPLTKKGTEIMSNMTKEYGFKKGKAVFYASRNKGTIKGVDKAKRKDMNQMGSMPKKPSNDFLRNMK